MLFMEEKNSNVVPTCHQGALSQSLNIQSTQILDKLSHAFPLHFLVKIFH